MRARLTSGLSLRSSRSLCIIFTPETKMLCHHSCAMCSRSKTGYSLQCIDVTIKLSKDWLARVSLATTSTFQLRVALASSSSSGPFSTQTSSWSRRRSFRRPALCRQRLLCGKCKSISLKASLRPKRWRSMPLALFRMIIVCSLARSDDLVLQSTGMKPVNLLKRE